MAKSIRYSIINNYSPLPVPAIPSNSNFSTNMSKGSHKLAPVHGQMFFCRFFGKFHPLSPFQCIAHNCAFFLPAVQQTIWFPVYVCWVLWTCFHLCTCFGTVWPFWCWCAVKLWYHSLNPPMKFPFSWDCMLALVKLVLHTGHVCLLFGTSVYIQPYHFLYARARCSLSTSSATWSVKLSGSRCCCCSVSTTINCCSTKANKCSLCNFLTCSSWSMNFTLLVWSCDSTISHHFPAFMETCCWRLPFWRIAKTTTMVTILHRTSFLSITFQRLCST